MASGDGVAKVWHQAELIRYHFPEAVKVLQHPKHGPMLATTDGLTLYARDTHRFTLAGGSSHDDRSALWGKPSTGARLGISTCQGECLEEFTPLNAATDAQPWVIGPLSTGATVRCSGPTGAIRFTSTRPTRCRVMPLHMTYMS